MLLRFKSLLTASVLSLLTTTAFSHERFMLPSHTLLSGDKGQSVTLSASISNAIFHPDRPYADNSGANVGALKPLFNALSHQLILPDGTVKTDLKWQAFSRMSVADVTLNESGTYRVSLVQPDIYMTTFKKTDGKPARLFGQSPQLPKGATDIVRRTTASRVETFITLNSPTPDAVNPTGVGLEIGGNSHPNDLFVGEGAHFTLLFNGKALKQPATVKVIKSGTRHRNDRNEQPLTVEKNGTFSFNPTQAGFYLLAASTQIDNPAQKNVDVKHYSLYLTLEVFPQ